MAKKRVAKSTSFPVPVGGWNARDSLDLMSPTDAIIMQNIFPRTGDIVIRNGFRPHSTSLGSGAVSTLAEHVAVDGTKKLIACANGNIYDATTYDAAASSLASGFTVNRWQHVLFRNVLILVNGTDQPQQYDGSAVTAATYTGVTDNDLINVTSYKSRLYFVEKDSCKIWYGGVDDITGALTEYDVSSIFTKGGYIIYAGSSTQYSDSVSTNIFIIVSSQGEVLIYSGDNPADTNWQLIARYVLPVPLGNRSCLPYGSDLLIYSQQGVIPLSEVLASANSTTYSKLSDKIQNAFSEAVSLYKDNIGWLCCSYPRGNYLLFNVPIATDTMSEQYVVNTLTGAWCKFKGQNACSWTTYNEKLYFGGIDGVVYEADIGANDNGAAIETDLKTSFNYYSDRESLKRFTMLRPLIIGDTATTFLVDVDTDFSNRELTGTVSITGNSGSAWDEATWDVDSWDSSGGYLQNWYSITGLGRCASVRMKGNYNNAQYAISAFNISWEAGGLF